LEFFAKVLPEVLPELLSEDAVCSMKQTIEAIPTTAEKSYFRTVFVLLK
jgi:hypothetical protein